MFIFHVNQSCDSSTLASHAERPNVEKKQRRTNYVRKSVLHFNLETRLKILFRSFNAIQTNLSFLMTTKLSIDNQRHLLAKLYTKKNITKTVFFENSRQKLKFMRKKKERLTSRDKLARAIIDRTCIFVIFCQVNVFEYIILLFAFGFDVQV